MNCSVDLDAESLLGFKTLSYEGEKQMIEFIPGPVINAMKMEHFYILMRLIWQSQRPYH